MDAATLRATASRLLTTLGQPATLTRFAVTEDVVTGVVTRTASATSAVQVALLPASKGTVEAFDNRTTDAGLERRDLRFAYVSAPGFSPAPGDQLQFGGETWTLLGATEVGLQGQTVVVRCGLARAA